MGGSYGYETFLKAMRDPNHPQHTEYLDWIGGSFDAESFDPARVRFENPTRRLREVYGVV